MRDSVLCRGKNAFRLVQFEAPEADMGTPLVKVSLLSHLSTTWTVMKVVG